MKKTTCGALLIVSVIFLASSFVQPAAPAPGVHFNHLALYVYDLQASARFYRDILQLDTIPEPFHDGRHVWLGMGAHNQLHLIAGNAPNQPHTKDTHLCLSVPSMVDFVHRLDAAGINYGNWNGDSKTPTLRADGVKQIYLQDPDGFWVEINDDRY